MPHATCEEQHRGEHVERVEVWIRGADDVAIVHADSFSKTVADRCTRLARVRLDATGWSRRVTSETGQDAGAAGSATDSPTANCHAPALAGSSRSVSDRVLAELAGFYNHTLDEVRELLRERAGVREREAGTSREDAESAALNDVRRMLALERLGPRAATADETVSVNGDTKRDESR